MPPPIVDLANHLRRVNKWNLFCLVEFGDSGNIVAYPSGQAKWSKEERQIDFHGDNRVYFYQNDQQGNKDGEERMTHDFEIAYKNYGKGAEHLTIFTAASPCAAKCADAILRLAFDISCDHTIPVRTITILYHEEYHSSADSMCGGLAYTINKLDNSQVGNVVIRCEKLHSTFIDSRTVHNSWH